MPSHDKITKPFGEWESGISSESITASQVQMKHAQPVLVWPHVYWVEGRPMEQGRQVTYIISKLLLLRMPLAIASFTFHARIFFQFPQSTAKHKGGLRETDLKMPFAGSVQGKLGRAE